MKRSELRSFLRAGVSALNPQMDFGSGRVSEFNSKRKDTNIIQVWQVTKPVDVEITKANLSFDSWSVELLIALKDTQDSVETKYESIIDQADEIGQKLTLQYNRIIDLGFEGGDPRTWKQVLIKGIKRDPMVKAYGADCLTGIILSFTLSAPDLTNYCP